MSGGQAYRHGYFIEEVPTRWVTPALAEPSMPVAVGTAPVQNLPDGVAAPVNEPRLIYNMSQFVAEFGGPLAGDNKEDYTLYQAAENYLARYKVAPMVCINVFDPAKHQVSQDDALKNDKLTVGAADPSKVLPKDIIGGVDSVTLKRTGLALVDEVFPRFRLNPGQILAPKYSKDVPVARAVGAACTDISGLFRAIGIIEIADEVTRHTDAPAWLNDNNLVNPNLQAMFGDCLNAGVREPGSIHWAGVTAARDARDSSNVPYWSPSNFQLVCDGMVHANNILYLTPAEAGNLNGQGICTGLNMIGGLRAWGDQTAAFPGNTDPKDAMIPIRRMFNWVGNTMIKTCWQFVSNPVNRRLIETVQDTVNVWLNGLVGRGFLLKGVCDFEMVDNPQGDLIAGTVRWHNYLTPPSAGRELIGILEYDPSGITTLYQ